MILGEATNLIFAGVIGSADGRPGTTKQQVVDGLRAAGKDTLADMLSAMRPRAGRGHRLRRRSAQCCCWRSALYVVVGAVHVGRRAGSSTASCSARSTGCASEVADKIDRLPLTYFDGQPRGELLSRVTNDIDNIAQTLQQTLAQLLTNLLTLVGVLVMMFCVSPLLAVIALVTSRSRWCVTMLIGKRSQKLFAAHVEVHRRAERPDRGGLHRPRPGEGLRPPARGRGRPSRPRTSELYEAAFGAQFISRHHHAGDVLHREPQLRR